jgi:hypothetical protein
MFSRSAATAMLLAAAVPGAHAATRVPLRIHNIGDKTFVVSVWDLNNANAPVVTNIPVPPDPITETHKTVQLDDAGRCHVRWTAPDASPPAGDQYEKATMPTPPNEPGECLIYIPLR